MKATFLSRVVASDYRTLVFKNSPQVVSTMDNVSWETWDTIFKGMRKVVNAVGGTAAKYLGGPEDVAKVDDTVWPLQDGRWPLANDVAVCAKTGTAEHSSGGSDHAVFVCFAPMEDPQVAIAIFGEKAAHGGWLAPAAEDILEAYFDQVSASEVYTYENQIG